MMSIIHIFQNYHFHTNHLNKHPYKLTHLDSNVSDSFNSWLKLFGKVYICHHLFEKFYLKKIKNVKIQNKHSLETVSPYFPSGQTVEATGFCAFRHSLPFKYNIMIIYWYNLQFLLPSKKNPLLHCWQLTIF